MRGIQRVEVDGREVPRSRRAELVNPRTLGAAASEPPPEDEEVSLDAGSGARIRLVDDGRPHEIRVTLG
jgi:hypothetical protein